VPAIPDGKIPFGGRVLLLGCGSVSRCLQPLLLRHLDLASPDRLTIMDFEDLRERIPETLAAGVRYVQERITPESMDRLLSEHLGAGDLLIDLAWNIDCGEIVQWCHDHGVLYVNTSVELWDPYTEAPSEPPPERTLYVRHMALRKRTAGWSSPGPTAVVEHGANPGLVSHWTKRALTDLGTEILARVHDLDHGRRSRLEAALAEEAWNRIAMETGTKVIHISERDTQIGSKPKEVGEFVNTWSVEGFFEEGVAPAEMGWGTHERTLPPLGWEHPGEVDPRFNPRTQICLAQPGIDTYVRSWVPKGGPIIGMVVRHGESFTISDHLTVWDGDRAVYRPTVHYAYQPADAAIVSLHELRMTGYRMQERQRIMDDEIVSGDDELGVLLMGHDLTGWWVGSQLSIEETRELVPGQNATTLQVAASVLGAVAWMVEHPDRGLLVPDDLDHRTVLRWADPYLGPCPSVRTDWTPLKDRVDLYERFDGGLPDPDDLWQFGTFRVPLG
jgi:homospermidine synthase